MNEQILISLSIITSFHNKSKSILDAFLPLVEYGIAMIHNETDYDYFDTKTLQEKILLLTGININSLTLKSLLKRLKRDKKIELLDNNEYYRIIASFKSEQDNYLAAVQSNHRDTHKFVKEYKSFSGDERDESTISVWIYEFITEYCKYIDVKNNNVAIRFEREEYKDLLRFLNNINQYDNDLTSTFHNIYFGANICSLIESSKKIIAKTQFSSLIVYLDSNFILRLMGLQAEPFSKEAKELFAILKGNKIKIYIFQQTIDEIKSVLDYYLKIYKKEKEQYSYIIEKPEFINGVLGSYFRNNYSITQIEEIIDSVNNFISKNEIQIDNLTKYNITIDEQQCRELYDAKYSNLADNSKEACKAYRLKKCQHYLQINNVISEKRYKTNCSASCLGNSKYVFLTCDLKLYRYIKSTTKNYLFPAIISQEILANDLLFFDPKAFGNISFQLLTSLYASSTYIDVHALDKLKETICDIADENLDEATFIIKATRNCENYSILNEIAEDEENDRQKLTKLAEEERLKENNLKKSLVETTSSLTEKESALSYANDQISQLSNEITELKKNEDLLNKRINTEKDKREKVFIDDMKKYIKLVKKVSVAFSVLFAIVAFITMFILGSFKLLTATNWWGYLILSLFLIFNIAEAIINGTDNKWVNIKINKKAKKLSDKYGIDNTKLSIIMNEITTK